MTDKPWGFDESKIPTITAESLETVSDDQLRADIERVDDLRREAERHARMGDRDAAYCAQRLRDVQADLEIEDNYRCSMRTEKSMIAVGGRNGGHSYFHEASMMSKLLGAGLLGRTVL